MKSPLKIVMPAHPLDGGKSGIGVYIREMIAQLSRYEEVRLMVLAREEERSLIDLGANAQFHALPKRISNLGFDLFYHASVLPLSAAKLGGDILFLPAGNRRMSPFIKGMTPPCIAVVHDLAQFHLKDKYDPLRTFYATRVLPLLWRNASSLIAVSQATKRDLHRFIKIPDERIHVAMNGARPVDYATMDKDASRRKVEAITGLVKPYILYVARIEHPGKNHVGLLEGYARLLGEKPDLEHDLLFVGEKWSGAEVVDAKVKALGLAERAHFTGFVEYEMLRYFYRCADLFAMPSLFEGFGIPLVEAMAAGVPVVASDRASIPEVLGSVGFTFDPLKTETICKALRHGLFDESFRKRAQKQGVERAKQFTWERSGKDTLAILAACESNVSWK